MRPCGFVNPVDELAAGLEKRFDSPVEVFGVEVVFGVGVREGLALVLDVTPFALSGALDGIADRNRCDHADAGFGVQSCRRIICAHCMLSLVVCERGSTAPPVRPSIVARFGIGISA
jgi:hypothetical protein